MAEVHRRTIAELLSDHPFFRGLDPAFVEKLAGCAVNVHVNVDQYLFRAHDKAEHFYLIRRGRIALEMAAPSQTAVVVETADAGNIVGLSWLVPPYSNYLDGRAVEETSAVALDTGCLTAACDRDPELGYHVMQRVAAQQSDVIQSARLRLLDMYGGVGR